MPFEARHRMITFIQAINVSESFLLPHYYHKNSIPVHWCRDCKVLNYTVNLLMLTYICSSVKTVTWLIFLYIFSHSQNFQEFWLPLSSFIRMSNCQTFQGPLLRLSFWLSLLFLAAFSLLQSDPKILSLI